MNQAMKQFFNIQQNSIVPTSVNVIEGNKYMYECETFFSVDYKTGFGGEFGVQGDRFGDYSSVRQPVEAVGSERQGSCVPLSVNVRLASLLQH